MFRKDNIWIIPKMHYKAVKAVLFYRQHMESEANREWVRMDYGPLVYATAHDIKNGKLTSGVPINQAFISQLSSPFILRYRTDEKDYFISDRILYYSERYQKIAWWRPAGRQAVMFSGILKDGDVNLPALVFVYDSRKLLVYSLKKNLRPTPDTILCSSPFFNLGCMGDVKLPCQFTPADIGKLEGLFFTSKFTSAIPPQFKKADPHKLWKSLIGTNKKFPVKELVEGGTFRRIVLSNNESFDRRY